MIKETADWLWEKGGLPLLIAAFFAYIAYAKDRDLRREHRARVREAKRTAVIYSKLLSKSPYRGRIETIPDEDDSSVIDVRDKLEHKANKELDSDIEDLLRRYLENGNGKPPR